MFNTLPISPSSPIPTFTSPLLLLTYTCILFVVAYIASHFYSRRSGERQRGQVELPGVELLPTTTVSSVCVTYPPAVSPPPNMSGLGGTTVQRGGKRGGRSTFGSTRPGPGIGRSQSLGSDRRLPGPLGPNTSPTFSLSTPVTPLLNQVPQGSTVLVDLSLPDRTQKQLNSSTFALDSNVWALGSNDASTSLMFESGATELVALDDHAPKPVKLVDVESSQESTVSHVGPQITLALEDLLIDFSRSPKIEPESFPVRSMSSLSIPQEPEHSDVNRPIPAFGTLFSNPDETHPERRPDVSYSSPVSWASLHQDEPHRDEETGEEKLSTDPLGVTTGVLALASIMPPSTAIHSREVLVSREALETLPRDNHVDEVVWDSPESVPDLVQVIEVEVELDRKSEEPESIVPLPPYGTAFGMMSPLDNTTEVTPLVGMVSDSPVQHVYRPSGLVPPEEDLHVEIRQALPVHDSVDYLEEADPISPIRIPAWIQRLAEFDEDSEEPPSPAISLFGRSEGTAFSRPFSRPFTEHDDFDDPWGADLAGGSAPLHYSPFSVSDAVESDIGDFIPLPKSEQHDSGWTVSVNTDGPPEDNMDLVDFTPVTTTSEHSQLEHGPLLSFSPMATTSLLKEDVAVDVVSVQQDPPDEKESIELIAPIAVDIRDSADRAHDNSDANSDMDLERTLVALPSSTYVPLITLSKSRDDEECPDPELPELSPPPPRNETISQTPTPPASPPSSPALSRRALSRDTSATGSPRLSTIRPAWSIRASDAPALGLSASFISVDESSLPPSSPLRPVADITTTDAATNEEEGTPQSPPAQSISLPGSFPLVSLAASAVPAKLGAESSPSDGASSVATASRPRAARSPIDVVLAMQLRPGMGLGADSAWMVRFLMTFFGWFAVLLSGTGEYGGYSDS